MGSGPTVRAWNPLPGDPAGLHETGRISPAFADGRVAARAAASSAVGVGVVGALPLPAPTQASQQQQPGEKGVLRAGGDAEGAGGLTWSGSACRGGTCCPCWLLFPWRPSATTSVCCSASCCDGGGSPCRETPPSSCRMCASGAPGMPRGCGGAPAPDWSGGGVWRSGLLLSCSSSSKAATGENKAQKGFFFFEGQSQNCLVPLRQLQDQRGCAYFL